jgi:twinkle protein
MQAIDREYILAKARDGQVRVVCPACGPNRKTKNDPTLSIKQDASGILWTCHHCGVTGSMGRGGKVSAVGAVSAVVPIKTYSAEEVDFGGLDYLASRGISEGTAKMLGICSGRRFFKKSGKELESIGFLYRHQDRATAIKWRSLSTKEFTQDGSAQTLFLADRLHPGQDVIVTEGEFDAVSFYEAGIPAVSIPSGALAEGTADDAARLKWLSHHDELIQKAENVYLAVDMDGPGQTTANELARRIGKLKCWRISFPPGCKDANDTLVQHGAEVLASCKAQATRWPVEGLASPSDFLEKVQSLYREGLPRGASTGWPGVDELFTLNPGSLVIVTGTPGSGKSQMIDNMLVNAMKQHNWRVAYASFENPPELHLAKLISLHTAKPFGDGPTPRISENEMLEAMGWVNERLTFLTNDGVMPTVESLVERFEAAVRRSGVKACVVDPFNFIRLNTKKDGGVDTESINEMLAAFKTFAMRAEVTFFLIAHPAKPMNSGPDWVPTGYSISGSAHFFNRADFGLTVQRKIDSTIFHVWKCRFPWQGGLGDTALSYDKATGLFHEGQNDGPTDMTFLEGFDERFPY